MSDSPISMIQIHEPGETPLPHAGDKDIAIGIDLGTTNSVVAVETDGAIEILRDQDGRALVPSVVAYAADGTPLVGDLARRLLIDRPSQVVSSVKRLMGRGLEDLKTLSGTLPYDVLPSQDDSPGMIRLNVAGVELTPVEVSSHILAALRERAEDHLGGPVAKAVVTVPAYFDDAARMATKDAARLAGLEVLRLVNEPTAAALAYGLDKGAEGLYVVYDLGGGTFDVSILNMEKGVFQVRATGGDAALGGDDFDHAVAEQFLAERRERLGDANLTTDEVKAALMTARLAKECLTTSEGGDWVLGSDDQVTRHPLTRTQFESLIEPLVKRTLSICRQVMMDAGIGAEEVKGVVLVGGSTRVPLVRSMVAELFKKEPLADIDPDEVVAVGAAQQAAALTGSGADALLLDVTPLSLGLETMGGMVEKIIPRNSPIPTAMAQEFTTYQDGQTAMKIHVVQGEREMSEQCRSLADFVLRGIPPMTAGAARIKVTFNVDADGILTVSAEEQTTGTAQQVEVKPSYGLTEDQMADMLRESMLHARDDMSARLLAESRVEANRVLVALRSALTKDGDLLDQAERDAIDAVASRLEKAVAGADRDLMDQRVVELDEATKVFAQRRMDRGISEALKGVQLNKLEREIT